MGRKSRLTPELAERIANLISTGNFTVVVCGLVGISESTFYRWMARGEKATRGVYREFWEQVKKAEAAREAKWVKDIDGDPSWQSKAWLLERRYPERWGRRDTLIQELTGKDGGPIRIEDARRELLARLEALRGSRRNPHTEA